MVPRYWKLNWLQIGAELPISSKTKPFMGIGPDFGRMTRGKTIPYPYNANGTINEAYFTEVDKIERHKQNIQDIMDAPLSLHALNEWLKIRGRRITEGKNE